MDQGKELPIQHTGNSWSTNQATHSECIQSEVEDQHHF